MKKKLLCAALLGGLALAQAASAQSWDDRWYVSGSTGVNFQDKDRKTEDSIFGTLGFGKFLTPNFSLEAEVNYQNPDQKSNPNLWWSQYGVSLDGRYHFRNADSKWWPYLRGGLGWQRHEDEYDAYPNPNSPGQREGSNLAVNLGAGLQFDFGRVNMRTEVGARVDFDDKSRVVPQPNQFTDLLASVGLTVALGPEPVAPVAPAPAPAAPEKTCADMDDDGDGVNNCNDKCPNSQPGQTIGPDGCPVPVSIDLKGVNFDFDKATLRPDAIAILNEAVEILKRYPELKVEVAGNTDQCGTAAYNQKLSERRAKVVYDYLVKNGIDSSRLAGPIGYGFSRPLEDKGFKYPQCRSEINRRTELNSQ
jgi:OOP family OmpA-OmpF porin